MRLGGTLWAMFDKFRVWGFRGVIDFALRYLSNCKHSRRLARLAAESRNTTPVRGITIIADVSGQVSLSKTMRDFILSLREVDIPVQVYDTSRTREIPKADVQGLITPESEFNLRKYDHIVMMFRSPLDEKLVPDIKCARIAFHESNHGIDSMAPYLKESGDAIIAMSDFNYNYFKRAFPTQQVFKIVYPLRIAQKCGTPREELRAKYGLGAKDFVVFFNFDFGSYYRKNAIAAIKAFANAFPDVPNAKLVFKTKNAEAYPKRVIELENAADDAGIRDRFIHISSYLPRTDVDGLTNACDVYVSLHKSEGFGLGMAEAMSCGKPVVATDWSANTEFCRPDTSWLVPYKITPILPHEYLASMVEWAEPDVATAAKHLRDIYDNPVRVAEKVACGKAYIKDHFSIANFKASVNAFLDGGNRSFVTEGCE